MRTTTSIKFTEEDRRLIKAVQDHYKKEGISVSLADIVRKGLNSVAKEISKKSK